jgi:PLP dependent protein
MNREVIDYLKSLPHSPVVVAATKYVDHEVMRELFAAGMDHFGENIAQDLLKKKAHLSDLPIHWHFIGHLQTNKVKMIINEIECLHSLDSIRLAQEIQNHRNRTLDCFVEVHISQEVSKYGLRKEDVIPFIENMQNYDKINIIGLMGMASHTLDVSLIRKQFQILLDLQSAIQSISHLTSTCNYLSFGMSNDYRIALEMKATHLRLGSILFRNEE